MCFSNMFIQIPCHFTPASISYSSIILFLIVQKFPSASDALVQFSLDV